MLWDTFVIMYAPTIKTTAPPSMIKWFLFKFKCKLNHTKWTVLLECFQCVDTLLFASISRTILHGRDAILRVRDKWLIINMVSQLWADVQYHVPTGFGFSPKASGFYPFDDATDLASEGGGGDVVWMIQATAWNQTCRSTNDWCEALASLKGCFLCFCFSTPSI